MTLKHLFSLANHHRHPVSSVHVLNMHCILLSADISGLLIVWSLKTRKVLCKRQFDIQILAVSSDQNNSVFVQFRNAEFLVFRIESDYTLTDAPIKRLLCAEYSFCRHLVMPNQFLVLPVKSGLEVIKLGDYESILDDFEGISQHGDIMALAVSGTILAVGFEDGDVLLYNTSTMLSTTKPLKTFPKISPESITCLHYLSETELLIGSATKSLLVLNIDSGVIISNEKEFRDAGVSAVAAIIDKPTVYSGGWDGKLREFRFDRESGKLEPILIVLEHHYDTINDLQIGHLSSAIPIGPFQTTQEILVSAGKDCIINIWQF